MVKFVRSIVSGIKNILAILGLGGVMAFIVGTNLQAGIGISIFLYGAIGAFTLLAKKVYRARKEVQAKKAQEAAERQAAAILKAQQQQQPKKARIKGRTIGNGTVSQVPQVRSQPAEQEYTKEQITEMLLSGRAKVQ